MTDHYDYQSAYAECFHLLTLEREKNAALEEQLARHGVCPCCRHGCTDPDCCTAAETNGVAVIAQAKAEGARRANEMVAHDLMLLVARGGLSHTKRELLLELSHRYAKGDHLHHDGGSDG